MTDTFTTLGGRLTLTNTQPRPTEDPLWLTAFIPPLPNGSRVLDAGTGSGIAALSLLARQPHVYAEAADIDPALATLAQTNAHLNNLPLVVHTTDILNAAPFGHYDAILSNPPFHAEERGHTTSNSTKQQAHSLPAGDLPRWLTALTNMLTPTGSLHLILHTACEAELTTFAHAHNMVLHLTPLQSSESRPPKRLLALLERAESASVHHHPAIPAYDPTLRQTHLT